MRDPARLKVWHRALQLAPLIYELSAQFPKNERYGLTTQCRRAAVSIAANVAEGYGRGSQREFARFLRIASGSATELHTLLIVARDIGMADARLIEEAMSQLDEIGRMTTSLVRRIDERLIGGSSA